MTETGLRERKKQATRAALGDAALRIALSDGIAAVTAESVGAACDVSPRTFRNYFATVEAAVLDGISQRAVGLVEALRRRPPGEPVWDSLVALVPAKAAEMIGDPSQALALFSLFPESRALMAQQLTVFEDVERMLAEAVADRLGTDVDADPVPHLLSSSTIAAVKVALRLWSTGHDDHLTDLVRQCLQVLRTGVPAGNAAPS